MSELFPPYEPDNELPRTPADAQAEDKSDAHWEQPEALDEQHPEEQH